MAIIVVIIGLGWSKEYASLNKALFVAQKPHSLLKALKQLSNQHLVKKVKEKVIIAKAEKEREE